MIEVLIASVVFLIGFAGLAMMHTYAAGFDRHAQRVDQATSVAWDLLSYLETVPYAQARSTVLKDSNTGNDSDDDMRDVAGLFAKTVVPATAYDHDETDLDNADAASGGNPCAAATQPTVDCAFRGYLDVSLSAAGRPTLDFNGNHQNDFQRYWLIEDHKNSSGQVDGVLISVIARWRTTNGSYRRVVLTGYRADPSLMATM